MSISVLDGERVVWSPALRVGRLFAEQLRALEAIVEVSSGFVIDDADEVHLDPVRFAAFVDSLLALLEHTNHPTLVTLAAGPAKVAVTLLHEMTGTWPSASERVAAMVFPPGAVPG